MPKLKEHGIRCLLSIIPSLESLSCIFFNSNSTLVVDYLKNQKLTKSLKKIFVISDDNSCLSEILQTNHLNLTKFFWKSRNCSKINESDIENFLIKQKNLKVFNLNLKQKFLDFIVRICLKINVAKILKIMKF